MIGRALARLFQFPARRALAPAPGAAYLVGLADGRTVRLDPAAMAREVGASLVRVERLADALPDEGTLMRARVRARDRHGDRLLVTVEVRGRIMEIDE